MLSRLADNIRMANIERVNVGHKSVRVKFCNVENALMALFSSFYHFVFAVVSISCQMSNVRNIHDMLNVVTQISQSFVQNIQKNVSAKVSNVGVVVNCRSAAIKTDIFFIRINRNKFFHFATHCVKKSKCHIFLQKT